MLGNIWIQHCRWCFCYDAMWVIRPCFIQGKWQMAKWLTLYAMMLPSGNYSTVYNKSVYIIVEMNTQLILTAGCQLFPNVDCSHTAAIFLRCQCLSGLHTSHFISYHSVPNWKLYKLGIWKKVISQISGWLATVNTVTIQRDIVI